jgi:hypothetical protein
VLLLGLLLTAVAGAQPDPAPQFTMAGLNAQPGYTNNTSIYTNWTWPIIINCPNGQSCQFEYCFTQHLAGYPNSLDYCQQSSPLWRDGYGPNGCTYEPTSNTGVAIVRHFFDTALPHPFSPSNFQQFSIIMSGLLP